MTHKILLMSASAALLVISCKASSEQKTDCNLITVQASVQEPSKTLISDGKHAVRWSESDAIVVNGNASVSTTVTSFGQKAEFKVPSSTAPYNAVYPASAYDKGMLRLPQSQKFVEGTFDPAAALMVASSGTLDLEFDVAVSLLKIIVNGDTDKDDISRIIIYAQGGENLSGALQVDFGSLSVFSPADAGRPVQIESTAGMKQGEPIYVAIPARRYSKGFRLRINDVNGDFKEVATSGEAIDAGAGEIVTINAAFVPGTSTALSLEKDMMSTLTAENHPRLLITDEQMEKIKSQVGTNDVVTRIHDIVMNQANTSLSKPALELPTTESGRRNMLAAVCRKAITQLWSCAYAYRYTGEPDYLDHAVKQLDAVCNFGTWLTELSSLNMAEMSTAVGVAYDWLYKSLNAKQRKMITDALDSCALTPTLNQKWSTNFFNAKSNWEPVCCGGLTLASLAAYEAFPDKAYEIIGKCIESNQQIAPTFYTDNGNSGEGYGYWIYGSSFQVLLNWCLESTIGLDYGWRIPGYYRTADFFLNLESPIGYVFNYSDSSPLDVSVGIPLWYFAYKTGNASLVANEVPKLDTREYQNVESVQIRLLAMVLPWAADLDYRNLTYPDAKLYWSDGSNCIATGRTGWTTKDSFFGLKGGFGCKTHGHLDVGSFVFDSQGVRWSYDVGNPSYLTIEPQLEALGGDFWNMNEGSMRWTVNSMNNFCHSTLTLGGALHNVRGLAVIKGTTETDDEVSCTMDLTSVFQGYAKSVTRTVRLTSDQKLHVIDSIQAAGSAVPVEWRMITKATPEVSEGSIRLTCSGKTEYLKVESESAVELCTFSLDKVNDYDMDLSAYSAVGFKTEIPAWKTRVYKTVLTPAL